MNKTDLILMNSMYRLKKTGLSFVVKMNNVEPYYDIPIAQWYCYHATLIVVIKTDDGYK